MAKKPKPRSDGRYQVKRMVDGKAKIFYGTTYDEAEASARAAGQHSITKNDTLGVWLKYWLANVVKPNVAAGTLSNYTTRIDKHLTDSEIGRTRLRDITTQTVRQFVSLKLEKLSPRTVLMLHHFLKSGLQQAVDDAVMHRNPAGPVKRPRMAPKKDKFLETEVVRKLLQEAKGDHKNLLLLAWTSGLRREEILGLCWSDFKAGSITVRRSVKKGGFLSTELKTPSTYRTVPLPLETIKALNEKEKDQIRSCQYDNSGSDLFRNERQTHRTHGINPVLFPTLQTLQDRRHFPRSSPHLRDESRHRRSSSRTRPVSPRTRQSTDDAGRLHSHAGWKYGRDCRNSDQDDSGSQGGSQMTA